MVGTHASLGAETYEAGASKIGPRQPQSPLPFPISKLRGVPTPTRMILKRHKINTCPQLLAAAARADKRAALASATGIAPDLLTAIVQRADMERVRGIGAVFDIMLEIVGVCDVVTLAEQDAAALHAQLADLNQRERLARRSPTREEVEAWIEQANLLPRLVTY